MALDIKTLLLMNLITSIAALITMSSLWKQHHKRYKGLSLWLLNVILQAISIVLFVLRGIIPDFFSIPLANLALQVAAWLILVGLERFFGIIGKHRYNLALLIIFALSFTYWSIVEPDLHIRNLLVPSCMAIITGQISYLTLIKLKRPSDSGTRLIGYIMLLYTLINCARFLSHLVRPTANNDFYKTTAMMDIFGLIAYLSLSIFLVFSLLMIINQRLLKDVRAQEEKFVKAFHSSPYAIIISRLDDGKIFEVNEGFERIAGYTRDEVLNKTANQLQLWGNDTTKQQLLTTLAEKGVVRNMEGVFRTKDNSLLICVLSAELLQIAGEACVISCVANVTEQIKMRERLQKLATHDVLTGLPNRMLFFDRFSLALASAQRNKSTLAIISLDLDFFKEINDAHGHEFGDLVLIEAARRIQDSLRRTDTVARFGGDEFVLLVSEIHTHQDIVEVAQKIQSALAQSCTIQHTPITIHASLGVALYPDHGQDLQSLLRRSDEALYAVKSNGRNGYEIAQ